MTNIELRSGTWKIDVNGRCEIFDENGENIHSSNCWESTAIHLAMALEENRRLRKPTKVKLAKLKNQVVFSETQIVKPGEKVLVLEEEEKVVKIQHIFGIGWIPKDWVVYL